MKRFTVLLSVAVVFLSFGTVVLERGQAHAQDATPPPGGFEIAPGVTAEALAFVPGQDVPSLYRVTIDPGVTYSFDPAPDISLLYGETGSLVVTLDAPVTVFHAIDVGQPGEAVAAGDEFRIEIGDYVVFPPLVDGEVTNAGKEPASVMVASIMPMPGAVPTPATPIP